MRLKQISLLLFACLYFHAGISQVLELSLHQNWALYDEKTDKWYPAHCPSSVYTDLYKNQLIENPFWENHEKDLQWVAEKDWIYRCEFGCDSIFLHQKQKMLVFDGIDTYADIVLNGKHLGKTDNMFLSYQYNVNDCLQEKNILEIKLKSPFTVEKSKSQSYDFDFQGGSRVFTRKAAYHYGWDWAPQLVPMGIWKKVFLQAFDSFNCESIFVQTEKITDTVAELSVEIELNSIEPQNEVKIRVSVNQKQALLHAFTLNEEVGKATFTIRIKNPQLWWTHDYGQPYLYDLHFDFIKNGRVVLSKNIKYGIRTIELVRQPDEFGQSFYFQLNGKPLFAKGANYVPQDIFLEKVQKADIDYYLNESVEQNMNMLRVWGGGVYQNDEFYSLCDEKGLLIWQDFMFACAMYPYDTAFLENVKNEAEYQIKRLRNHTCLALWCGNNEIDEAWHNWGWQKPYSESQKKELWQAYQTLFHELLSGLANQYCSQIPYHASSPMYGRGNSKSLFFGDSHFWSVWHDAYGIKTYQDYVPRFMSEFGFQSYPEMSTIKTFTDIDENVFDTEEFAGHQKHPRGNELIRDYMQRNYGIIPPKQEHFIYLSQLLQARALQTAIEAHRRAMPYCMGSLYWQLNDCWPAVSWSAIDYEKKRKAGFYAVRKAFAPLLISFQDNDGTTDIYVVSDRLKLKNMSINIYYMDFEGKILKELHQNIVVESNSSKVYFSFRPAEKYLCDKLLWVELLDEKGEKLGSAHHLFVPDDKLKLKEPNIKIEKELKNDTLQYILTSDTFVRSLCIQGENHASNHYFDLLPNQKKVIFMKEKLLKNDTLKAFSLCDVLRQK